MSRGGARTPRFIYTVEVELSAAGCFVGFHPLSDEIEEIIWEANPGRLPESQIEVTSWTVTNVEWGVAQSPVSIGEEASSSGGHLPDMPQSGQGSSSPVIKDSIVV